MQIFVLNTCYVLTDAAPMVKVQFTKQRSVLKVAFVAFMLQTRRMAANNVSNLDQ